MPKPIQNAATACDRPLVSIGMTAFNAQAFVAKTLDSLLAQDYPNLELCISDNASTDSSSDICREYAGRDSRITYSRNEENIGAVRNWNRALEMAGGRYFMWASDHDLWDSSYVSRSVHVLERQASAVLVYPRVTLIDEHGDTIEELPDRLETSGLDTLARFRRIVWNLKRCHMIHGVMRIDALRQLGGFPNVWAMDMPLLGALSVAGEFVQLDDFLYFRRENRADARSSTSEETKSFHVSQLDPSKSDERQQLSQRELRRETRNAQLRLLWKTDAGVIAKTRLSVATLHAYWSRCGVGFPGVGLIRGIIPKSIRRSPRLRHTTPRSL